MSFNSVSHLINYHLRARIPIVTRGRCVHRLLHLAKLAEEAVQSLVGGEIGQAQDHQLAVQMIFDSLTDPSKHAGTSPSTCRYEPRPPPPA